MVLPTSELDLESKTFFFRMNIISILLNMEVDEKWVRILYYSLATAWNIDAGSSTLQVYPFYVSPGFQLKSF